VIFSRIRYLVAPSRFSSHPPSRLSVKLSSRTMKMAKAYYRESGKGFNMKAGNLSSTLDKLYAWEKKLYKEVKVWVHQTCVYVCCFILNFVHRSISRFELYNQN
jgi:hypothetical protein